MDTRAPVTDASLSTVHWVVGERYVVHRGIDQVATRSDQWLPIRGSAVWPRPDGDGNLIWHERDWRGKPMDVPDEERKLLPGELWVQVIVNESPDPHSLTPRVWLPGERPGLANELARLATADDEAIVTWVRAHGFVGIRANPREWFESVEEIRLALARLAQARDLMKAIRELKGEALRRETERLLSTPGLLTKLKDDPRQPLAGPSLARSFGVSAPPGQRWTGAGAYMQALYGLSSVLQVPLGRFIRVDATIAPTDDGMRLQSALVAVGPLAMAYLQTLNEASWPAIAYVGDIPRINWLATRRCQRCGEPFKPRRRDQRWCGKRCRWAASKARS